MILFHNLIRGRIFQMSAVALGGLVFGFSVQGFATTPNQNVSQAIKARLPKTQVSSVNCDGFGGLCEVVAGTSLFYVDQKARFLIIGRLYDMETRQDVTAARLLSLNPELLIGGAARPAQERQGKEGDAQPAQLTPTQQAANVGVQDSGRKVSLASLPKTGAIVWGASSGQSVTVFSDFRCGYCRALSDVLAELGVRVIERPISVLGTRTLSEQVYCAKNQQRALRAAYAGEGLQSPKCDVSGLDANEAFARANGFGGTPVIVRSDGAVIEGYRPKEFLAKWLAGAKS
jgi:thiol:disulfide interchange protein DsbC